MFSTIKKITVFSLSAILSFSFLSAVDFQDKKEVEKAQKNMDQLEESMEKWEVEMEKWGDDLEKAIESGQPVPPIPTVAISDDDYGDYSLKLGVYLENLDFEEAYAKHYPYCYGVLVTSVIRGSNADRAGLTKGDIIMEFDGEQVRYEDHLISLRDSKKMGDTVSIKFFRNEKILTTDLTFAPVNDSDEEEEYSFKKSMGKKFSVGFGGGGPIALYVDYDFSAINQFIAGYGFSPIDASASVFFGGGGMGNMGGGWFIGGMGAGMMYDKRITVDGNYRQLNIESGFGGVQVVKKLPLFSSNVIMDMGTLIGGGTTTIELAQSTGNYSWDYDETGTDNLDDGNNWYARYQKDYFVLYPSVGVLVRIKKWFGIHSSAGYLMTYATKDTWKSKPFDFDVSGNSPDPISGPTYTVGIWFGY